MTTVADMCSLVTSGGTPSRSRSEYYHGGDIPWVKTGDLADGPIMQYGEKITELGLEKSAARLLPEGTVLIAMYGATVGRLGWLIEPAACNQASCAMVADPAVCDARWLFYALMYVREPLMGLASGAAQQNLNSGLIRNCALPKHSLDKQRAIAEVLGALDDRISANARLSACAADLVVALARQGKALCTLADVATRTTKSVKPEALSDTQVDHYSLPAYDDSRTPESLPASSIKSNKFAIESPCVLLAKLNPRIPRIWDVVELSGRPSLASTEFIVLEPEQVSSSVLWAVLSHPNVMVELLSMVAGTSGSHQRVRPDDVMALEITDPRSLSSETQEAVTALGRTVAQVRVENEELARTRDALLPLLMSGKVTAKDAEAMVGEVV